MLQLGRPNFRNGVERGLAAEECQDLGDHGCTPARVCIKINKVIVDSEKKYEENLLTNLLD